MIADELWNEDFSSQNEEYGIYNFFFFLEPGNTITYTEVAPHQAQDESTFARFGPVLSHSQLYFAVLLGSLNKSQIYLLSFLLIL